MTVSAASDHGLKTGDVTIVQGRFAGGTVPRRGRGRGDTLETQQDLVY